MAFVNATCRKCGYEWRPNPLMWRNNSNIIDNNGMKVLRCPSCGAKNYVAADVTRELRRYARNERLRRQDDVKINRLEKYKAEFKRLREANIKRREALAKKGHISE